MGGNPKMRYGVHIVAGVYLIYLAYQLIGINNNAETSGRARIIGTIGAIAFIVIGVVLVVNAARGLMKLQNEASAAAAAAEEEIQEIEETAHAEETVEKYQSSSERFRNMNLADLEVDHVQESEVLEEKTEKNPAETQQDVV